MGEVEYEKLSEEEERIATAVVNGAFKVHQTLGPGLLESIYKRFYVMSWRRWDFMCCGSSRSPFATTGSSSMKDSNWTYG
jgi:hypothetical protein